ncbi:Na-translocating system protein MpsC family protein [Bacillus sp. FJAT-44742]|uniref:Na-translocating system protein MpsC family protein n=1 Tax=Bacillus sp. FJAT-44742 TaxID=2014005 RepID=UPI000C24CFC2|nr:Na-translocating system protein MpsC family protein [Bacillus sp. FJAT-44742]
MSQENKIASYVGRLIRDHFGKGPKAIYVTFSHPYFTIYVEDFLGPMEKVLLGENDEMSVQHLRERVVATLIPEIKTYVYAVTDLEIKEFYYDWNLANKTGIFMGITSEKDEDAYLVGEYKEKEAIEQEMISVSIEAQKAPEKIHSNKVNDLTFMIVREGILVPIEKELISLGKEENLKVAKRKLEKRKLNQGRRFELLLNTKLKDIFVDWDFNLDRSIVTLILDPVHLNKNRRK